MVHKNRSSRKSCPVIDVSPLRNSLSASANKHDLSTSPRIGYTLDVPNRPIGSTSSSNLWYYNDMIKNNREQFNSLHFC
ncbi:uncharacterized protein LOC133327518 [Musca vetustissima]|uniref:uncharacterized protein LOC133327518 n=1 Tax=Musca vetustissima TaxID=27455 RepID=UPI002AB6AB9E|nr:uncharacterized protein LOC133327518 [Musca vetustissima]